MQQIEVIINAGSGTGGKRDYASLIGEMFNERGYKANIAEARTGAELTSFAEAAVHSESRIVVAGGGDGTLNAVASAVIDSGKTLGVLALGTLNHFAKDLNIPLDLEAAVDVIVNGLTVNVDAGEVNGRLFINNSSLGLYPEMVHGREQRQRLGFGKWHSLARSALAVFRRYPLLGVRLTADGKEMVTRTPFIFVGNNDYQVESFNIGCRERLDEGTFSVYMTKRTGRLALLRIAIKAVFGGLSQEKDFLAVKTRDILIETKRRLMRVAIDGEVQMIDTPIRYRICPQSLRVIVPENGSHEKQDVAK